MIVIAFVAGLRSMRMALYIHTYLQAQMLVEEGKIRKPPNHKEPPPGQAGRDVGEGLQPALSHDLHLLTRFAR